MIDTYLNIRTMIVSFIFKERTHIVQAPTCLTPYWFLFYQCSAIYFFICLSLYDSVIRLLNYKFLSTLYPTLLCSITKGLPF